jgi:hypothetical protein
MLTINYSKLITPLFLIVNILKNVINTDLMSFISPFYKSNQ